MTKVYFLVISGSIILLGYLFYPDFQERENLYETSCASILYLYRNKNKETILEDPWHRSFIVEKETNGYNIYSLGRDGILGGVGVDKDIYLRDCLKLPGSEKFLE